MAKDKHGRELKIGDKVWCEGVVVGEHPELTKIRFKTPGDEFEPAVLIHPGLVEKVLLPEPLPEVGKSDSQTKAVKKAKVKSKRRK